MASVRGFAVVDRGFPADFDAREQVGLGADRFEEARGLEAVVAEDLLVGVEGDGGAAPVLGGPEFCDRPERDAAGEALFVKLLVARDLHDHGIDSAFTTEAPTPCRPPEVS